MAKMHGRETRLRTLRLFERGLGRDAVARKLGLSRSIVGKWLLTCRAVGSGVFLEMGGAHRAYDFGTKVAAASAVVDRGRPKSEVMRGFGIASRSPLDSWCRAYREGGAEALRPRPKGRPKADPAPKTREEELEREVRRLEVQVAHLKNR